MKVFLTVDTECWPRQPDWREAGLRTDVRREVFGETAQGEFGVAYQMKVLNEHGLKAAFFVESLFASAVGRAPLQQIVRTIQDHGHEVQLHVHPEWLAWMKSSILPGRTAQNLKELSEDEQGIVIGEAIENLRACGARDVRAFRAGNYGANLETLRALAWHGLCYDTSYNACYLHSDCGLHTAEPLLQPEKLQGVWEIPITFFQDWPGHFRHVQLCACSSNELEHALLQAWRRGWQSFVLVSHSFELLKRRKQPGKPPLPDKIVVRRFERLCRFLARHSDKFTTCGFSDIDPCDFAPMKVRKPLTSGVGRTAMRVAEQLMRRAT